MLGDSGLGSGCARNLSMRLPDKTQRPQGCTLRASCRCPLWIVGRQGLAEGCVAGRTRANTYPFHCRFPGSAAWKSLRRSPCRYSSSYAHGRQWQTPDMATHSSLLAFRRKVYMRVLIAIDSSESSQTAVNEVAARPWPERSEFCVTNVFDPFPFSKAPAMIPGVMKTAQGLVEAAAEQLSAAGKKVLVSVLQGHPASSIVDAAEKWNADFVVIGSHGLGGLQRFFLGSTARIVVREAPCSVEIVRALPGGAKAYGRQGMRILLATDGSRYSMAAVRSVVERPEVKSKSFLQPSL